MVFCRSREREQEERIETMQMLGGAIAHELKTPLSGLMMSVQVINQIINKTMSRSKKQNRKYTVTFDEEEYNTLKQINESMKNIGRQGVSIVNNVLMTLKSSVAGEEKRIYNIKECIEQSITEYSVLNESAKDIEINIKSNFKVKCSLHYLKHVLFNLLKTHINIVGQI